MASSRALRRIVCLAPSATVILAAIDELDCVVACTEYCADVDPEIVRSSVAILADSWTANTEKIGATRPDLVIASVPYLEDAIIQILKSGARWFSFPGSNSVSTKGIQQITAVLGPQLKNSPA
jgi:ABC-type Fe3+-hydroxamate transport system substrate-binding protein